MTVRAVSFTKTLMHSNVLRNLKKSILINTNFDRLAGRFMTQSHTHLHTFSYFNIHSLKSPSISTALNGQNS